MTWSTSQTIEIERDEGGEVRICADHEGMRALASLFLSLSDPQVPVGSHMHLDDWNGVRRGSALIELVAGDSENSATAIADS